MKTSKKQIADSMTVIDTSTAWNRNAVRYSYKSGDHFYQGSTGQRIHKVQFDGQRVELDGYCTRERFINAVYEDLNS